MNVKKLRLVKSAPPKETSTVACACGSTWFLPYAVVFEEGGTVIGWSGPAHCIECVRPLTFFGDSA